jgi:arylsulfatase A-like enzyme
MPSGKPGSNTAKILVQAGWFGLVAGLVEGVGLLIARRFGFVLWNAYPSTPEFVGIAMVFNFSVFCTLGLFLVGVAKLDARLPISKITVAAFAFLAFFDWIVAIGRIRTLGALLLAAGLAAVVMRWYSKNEDAASELWRKTLPWLGAVAAVALIGTQGGNWLREWVALGKLPAPAAGAPNILFIVVDTLRADHLSAYGYPRRTSPELDRLAQEGVLFESAIATSSWTLPSHASLLTGRYPYEHGVQDGSSRGQHLFDDRYPSLAEVLQAEGYRTGAFSANREFFTRLWGFGRGFIRFEDYFQSVADSAVSTVLGQKFFQLFLRRLGVEDIPGRRRAVNITRDALTWINRDRGRPFFVFLNYFDTHDPYLPPQPYRSKFSKLANPGGILNEVMGRFSPPLKPEQMQSEIDAYDGAIAYVDEEVRHLMEGLEQLGQAKNTLVIFTSDHGESFGEHGLVLHQNALYREVIHVPLVFWWPDHIPATVRVKEPVSTIHIPATVLDLLAHSDQKPFPGPSLARLWKGEAAGAEWPVALAELAKMPYEHVNHNPAFSGWLKCLVTPQWHFIVHEKLGAELYDWRRDREELNNAANTPSGAAVTKEFGTRLQHMLESGKKSEGTATVEAQRAPMHMQKQRELAPHR